MTTIDDSIKEAITKNLPSMVATTLSAYISEAEKNILHILRLDKEVAARNDIIETQCKQLKTQEEMAALSADIDTRYKALAARELAAAREEARMIATVAVAEKDMALLVLDKFLKLPSVRINATASVGVPVEGKAADTYSGATSGTVLNAQNTETRTETPE